MKKEMTLNFTTKRGNKIEQIGVITTDKGFQYIIKVNGKLDEVKYTFEELTLMLNE